MGNQLAITPSVRLADVSSTLYLITPLGGENRNFFSTFHCFNESEASFLPRELLTRCSRPESHRVHKVCDCYGNTDRSNFSDVYQRLENLTTGVWAEPQLPAPEAFSTSGGLKVGFSNYTQFFLRCLEQNKDRGANDSTAFKARGVCDVEGFSAVCTLHSCAIEAPLSCTSGAALSAPGGEKPQAGPPLAPARAQDCVVKVFTRNLNDQSQSLVLKGVSALLRSMAEHVAAVDSTLLHNGPVNILFYDTVKSKDGDMFSLLQRPYIDLSLPERLATQPFYTPEDRLFACYQILQGLVQLHEQYGMVHGDLKPSNVLVQSGSGWLYLADIAPFKPSHVPAQNPAVFDYYYDTDDTRCCCLAPEKFDASKLNPGASLASALSTTTTIRSVTASTTAPHATTLSIEPSISADFKNKLPVSSFSSNEAEMVLDNMNVYGHTPAMDVFSAGCVMTYLLTDEPAFSLSGVLQLREQGTTEARKALVARTLSDRCIRGSLAEMLLAILCSLPDERPSARQVLNLFTPSLFPKSYKVLHEVVMPYLLARPPDHQVQILFNHLETILHACVSGKLTNIFHRDTCEETPHAPKAQASTYQQEAQRVMNILLPLLLHATRRASTDEATYRGVVCIRQVALLHCTLSTQLDLVLPHFLYILNSRTEFNSNIRIIALRVVCEIVGRVVAYLPNTIASALASKKGGGYGDNDHSDAFNSNVATLNDLKKPLQISAHIQQITLFDDFILPCMCELLQHSSCEEVGFLTELATRLPQLLLEARYCLEQRQTLSGAYKIVNRQGTFAQQLDALCNDGWYMFQTLFRLSLVPVSAAIMHQVPKVAGFLGDARTQEDLIPFLTTAITSSVRVQREVHPIAVLLHAVLQCPQIKTLRFFVEEGLRQRDLLCLKRTLDALSVVVRARKFTAWDTMTLVHQVLPHVISPFRAVSFAARRVIEAAARTYNRSEVLVYLECAVRPLLTQFVPLANFSSFPESVIRQDFIFPMSNAQNGPSSMLPGGAATTVRTDQMHKHRQRHRLSVALRSCGWNSPPGEFFYRSEDAPHYRTMALIKGFKGACGARDGVCCQTLPGASLDQVVVKLPVKFSASKHGNDSTAHKNEVEGGAYASARRDFHYQLKWREQQRLCLWRSSLSFDAAAASSNSSQKHFLDLWIPAPRHTRFSFTHGDGDNGHGMPPEKTGLRSGLTANHLSALAPATASPIQKELRPMAIPLDTKWKHVGAIYCMANLPCGRLLTAGACGEAMLWKLQIGSSCPSLLSQQPSFLSPAPSNRSALRLVTRISLFDHSTPQNCLTCCATRAGDYDGRAGSSFVALGGMNGQVHVLDTTCSSVVQHWGAAVSRGASSLHLEGSDALASFSSAVTAMAMVEEHVLLVATSAGDLVALDARSSPYTSAIWRTTLDPLDGACSALCPLYHTNRAFCFVAATYGGVARLYDLRFVGLCVRRDDVAAQLQKIDTASAKMCYAAAATEDRSMLENSSLFLDVSHIEEQKNINDRTSILCAAVDQIAAFTMALGKSNQAVDHASSVPISPEILFGMSNGNVCSLHLASGRVYPLLCPFSTAPTRDMLVQPVYGSLFTASEDGYLRYWSTRLPSDSHTLCCPPSNVAPEYEVIRVKQPHLSVDQENNFLPNYLVAQDKQSESLSWRYCIRERLRFSTVVAERNGKAECVAAIMPHRHHRDAILSLAMIQETDNASPGGDEHCRFLVSGTRDGSLTVWANEGP